MANLMNCTVSIGGGDYDAAECYEVNEVTARKPHRCVECHREIPKGAKYMRHTGKWDGEFDTIRTCLDCHEITTAFMDGGFLYGELWNDFNEGAFGDMTTACFDKLSTASAKQFLREKWISWKGLNAK